MMKSQYRNQNWTRYWVDLRVRAFPAYSTNDDAE